MSKNLVRRGKAGTYHVRVRVNGKELWRTTGQTDMQAARKRAKVIRRELKETWPPAAAMRGYAYRWPDGAVTLVLATGPAEVAKLLHPLGPVEESRVRLISRPSVLALLRPNQPELPTFSADVFTCQEFVELCDEHGLLPACPDDEG